jgi:hypothetical protein
MVLFAGQILMFCQSQKSGQPSLEVWSAELRGLVSWTKFRCLLHSEVCSADHTVRSWSAEHGGMASWTDFYVLSATEVWSAEYRCRVFWT